MPRAKKAPPKETLLYRSHMLTPTTERSLSQLKQEASDYLGWTISGSAIVRALLQHAATQDSTWVRERIFPFIEREIEQGRVWGKKK